MKANTDNPLDWRRNATQLVTQRLLLRREVEFASKCLTTSVWGTDVVGGEQHVDSQLEVRHAAPHARSSQLYKGVLDGKAKAVFNGRIVVEGNRIVAIGETGLDYFRSEGDLDWQRERFRTHIAAARRCGKLIIASSEEQLARLRALQDNAVHSGLDDLQWLEQEQVAGMEPDVRASAGLFSPSTGIIDVHELMLALIADLEPLQAQGLLDMTVERAEPGQTEDDSTLYRMEIFGLDHPGIIHEVSHALAGRLVSIEELSTEARSAPMAGDTVFEAHALLRVPAGISSEELAEILGRLGDELAVDIDVVRETAENL